MTTVLGMSPILWMTIFIIGYAIYLYSSSSNRESVDNKSKDIPVKKVAEYHQQNDIENRSSGAWLSIFLGGTFLAIGFIFLMYVLTHFSA